MKNFLLALACVSTFASAFADCYIVDDKHSDARYKVETNDQRDVFVSLIRHSERTEAAGIKLFDHAFVGNQGPRYDYVYCSGYNTGYMGYGYYGMPGCFNSYSERSDYSGENSDSKFRVVGKLGSRMQVRHKFIQADGKKHTHIAKEVYDCRLENF